MQTTKYKQRQTKGIVGVKIEWEDRKESESERSEGLQGSRAQGKQNTYETDSKTENKHYKANKKFEWHTYDNFHI